MEKLGPGERFSLEGRVRRGRMVREHGREYGSQGEAMVSIAAKVGCPAETPRRWVRQAERDDGLRPGPTSAEQARIRTLEERMIGRPLQRLAERRAARHFRARAVRADPEES